MGPDVPGMLRTIMPTLATGMNGGILISACCKLLSTALDPVRFMSLRKMARKIRGLPWYAASFVCKHMPCTAHQSLQGFQLEQGYHSPVVQPSPYILIKDAHVPVSETTHSESTSLSTVSPVLIPLNSESSTGSSQR